MFKSSSVVGLALCLSVVATTCMAASRQPTPRGSPEHRPAVRRWRTRQRGAAPLRPLTSSLTLLRLERRSPIRRIPTAISYPVQRLLPALSTYLGHAHLDGTSVYLSMTPELLHEASVRFDRYVNGEGHA